MDAGKKSDIRNLLLPALFVAFIALAYILRQQALSQDKGSLGTEVTVRVKDVRMKGGLNTGLKVTVTYQGETYVLHGVPVDRQFVMQNSMDYRWDVDAVLYKGKMYESHESIMLLADKLYLASLLGMVVVFGLMFLKLKEKMNE